MDAIRFGRQTCGTLAESAAREWLVTDGCGGYAMGTVAGLRTRRYHGLLVVATRPPGGRRLALAALDPVLVLGDARIRLAVQEWDGGVVDPEGYLHLESFALEDGLPRWRWNVGGVVLERELALARGRPAVGVVHRLVAAPGPVRLELAALGTWRDAHGDRLGNGPPDVTSTSDGAVFEGRWRIAGPGWKPEGVWYRGARAREEAARGLADREDLFCLGRFVAELSPGGTVPVLAWAGTLDAAPEPPETLIRIARRRAREIVARSRPNDAIDARLALAADQHVVSGPSVVAGYPWFGAWSRDTLTAYEGLFLETGRAEEGRALLARTVASLSEGLLPNTADTGALEYNSIDALPWGLHAVARHVTVTGDLDLAAEVIAPLEDAVARHEAGVRHGIHVDASDGLLAGDAEGLALTWMDARVDGVPVTRRAGKPVEVNALWASGLAGLARLAERLGRDASRTAALAARVKRNFLARFVQSTGVLDVVDGPDGDESTPRPNALFAVSLPDAPLRGQSAAAALVAVCRRTLLTSLGLRSLAPGAPGYRGRHRGSPAERDGAYHQGTVWPWLIGAYIDAALATRTDTAGVLAALEAHTGEHGLGSVSETADGDPPHGATGCPFQAWSVAELLRARRTLARGGAALGATAASARRGATTLTKLRSTHRRTDS